MVYLPRIAQRFRDDEKHGEVGHQGKPTEYMKPSYPMKAIMPGDTQEASGAHVVTRHGEAVLPAR